MDRLVLWDPVVRGSDYVAELEAAADRPLPEDDVWGVNGFPVTPPLRDELAGIDLAGIREIRAREVALVASRECDSHAELRDHLSGTGTPVEVEVIESDGDWNDVDEFGSALVPRDAIQRIVERLTGEGP